MLTVVCSLFLSHKLRKRGVDVRWIILGLLCLAGIINFADKAVAGLAAVPIMNEFNLSYGQWGIVGSSFYWLFAVSCVVISTWSDRWGTKRIITLMLIIWSFAQVGAFAITGLPLLILSRIILGAGEGPFFAVAVNHISKIFPPELRGVATSILSFGNKFGYTISAPFLVAIMVSQGWRMTFAILGLASLILIIPWVWLTRDTKENQVVVSQTKQERKKINWSKVKPILKSPTFIFSALAGFMGIWLLTFSLVYMPTYITQVKQYSQTEMGFIVATGGLISGILMIAIAMFSDYLFRKYRNLRKSRVLLIGVSLILSGVMLYTITLASSKIVLIVLLGLFGAFVSIPNIIGPHVINILIPERSGLLLGITVAFSSLAGILAPAVIGNIIELAGTDLNIGFNSAILLSVSLGILFALLYLIFVRPDKVIEKMKEEKVNEKEMEQIANLQ